MNASQREGYLDHVVRHSTRVILPRQDGDKGVTITTHGRRSDGVGPFTARGMQIHAGGTLAVAIANMRKARGE